MNNEKLTSFQWKVLKAALKIPFGQTRTYKWVAHQIGSPFSSRAVGQALRRNPYPVAIPCHRVIHSDGRLGAYAGEYGSRKEELLNLEQQFLNKYK